MAPWRGSRGVPGTMARLILHIGPPKTGTTALQSVFAGNHAALLSAGVLYPVKAEPASHKHALAGAWLTGRASAAVMRTTGLEGAALEDLSRRYWQALCAEIRSTPHETLVLSAECFFHPPDPRQPGLRDRLAEVCDSVEVVAYLRSPARSFLSRLNQNVRMFQGVRLGATEMYRPTLTGYRAAGLAQLSLNVFDPARLAGGDIVADFCGRYLPPTLPPLRRDGVERPNDSVSNEALVILNDLRASLGAAASGHPRRARAVAILRAADRELGGRLRPALRPEVTEALVARATDLPWLRDDCGIVFDDVDYGARAPAGLPDLTALRSVADFCDIDAARLAALRAMTDAPLRGLFQQEGWLRRITRRLRGGAR